MDFGLLRRLDDLVHARVRTAVADVLEDRASEEEHVLLHDTDAAAQIGELDVADILPVQSDAAAGGLIKARNQLAERRLAAAAGADQGQHLAGAHVQVDVLEHRLLLFVVGEGHVPELDFALDVLKRPGIRAVHDVRLLVHDRAEALEARHALRELLGELRQLADGALDAGDVHVERDQRGDIHLVFHDEVAARADDRQAHQVHHEVRAGEEAGHHLVIAALGVHIGVRAAGKLFDLLLLVAEGLGDADAGDGALDLRVDARRALLDRAGGAHHVPPAQRDEHDDQRHGDHQHQRQLPFDAPEHDKRARQRHKRDEQVLRAVVRQLRHLKQVRRHAGHEQAGAVLVVEAEAQLLQVREDRRTHIRLDAHAHHVSEIRDEPLRRHAHDEQREHAQHHPRERAHHLAGNVLVEHLARDDREEDIHQGDEQRAGHVQQKQAHVRLVVGGKFTDGAAPGRGLFFKGRMALRHSPSLQAGQTTGLIHFSDRKCLP